MPGASQPVYSQQTEVHEKLAAIVQRHIRHDFQKVIARHTLAAFEEVAKIVANQNLPLILDSGCGTGLSTFQIAKSHPDHFVLGIDKSGHRLAKTPDDDREPANCSFVRADLIDFWRLAVRANWRVAKHFLLYPNPWPKKNHLQRRFHAHPVFPDLVRLGEKFILRSNWNIYLQEFSAAFELATSFKSQVRQIQVQTPMTLFEKKYHDSGHAIYELLIEKDGSLEKFGLA